MLTGRCIGCTVYTVDVPDSVASLYVVELSSKDVMIWGLVAVNLVLGMILCCVCASSRSGKYMKYQPVVAGYSGTDTEA